MRIKEFLAIDAVEQADGDLDQEVTGLAYDSRKAGAGQIFFAVPGEKVDGHDFIADAVRRGAAAVVFSRAGQLAARVRRGARQRYPARPGFVGGAFFRPAEHKTDARRHHRHQW